MERVYVATGSLARIHKRAFDALSRTLKSIGARGQTTHRAYDANGNRTHRTDHLAGEAPDYTIAPDSNRLQAVADFAGLKRGGNCVNSTT